jgi:CDP-diglyceride synthetase
MLIDLGINSPVQLQEQFATTTFPGYSPLMPCAIIFSIWINDTMAYIVGSMIGKTPFSPISPKKHGKEQQVVHCFV